MNRERRSLWLAYGLWCYFWLVLLTAGCGILVIFLSFLDRTGRIPQKVGRWWAARILHLCRIRVTVEGLEHLQPGRTYVYAANHRSQFDIFVLLTSLPGMFSFVAKKSLFQIPIFGQAISRLGAVSIDRANLQEAIVSLNLAAQRVRQGLSMIIFPEGTRGKSRELLPFKKGVFIMAQKAGQPVVPVSLSGTAAIQPRGSLMVRPGPVRVVISPPIPPEDFVGRRKEELMARVRAAIAAHFDPDYPYGPAGDRS
ncbi:MAG: 1-acyl-sn-glycerol-3-phosphate acyltransferase [Deltaproteobacteria bacterium]|nr:1-acyl-sn-glycerol-3-phosphate acyltransferase [Deltaproteobacteria bacterium]